MFTVIAWGLVILILMVMIWQYKSAVDDLHALPTFNYEDYKFKTGDMIINHSDYFYRFNPVGAFFMNLGPQMWLGAPDNHVAIVIVPPTGRPLVYQPTFVPIYDEQRKKYVSGVCALTDLENYIKTYEGTTVIHPIREELDYHRAMEFVQDTIERKTETNIFRFLNQVFKFPIEPLEGRTSCTELMTHFMKHMDIAELPKANLVSVQDLREEMLNGGLYDDPFLINNVYLEEYTKSEN